MPDLATIAKQFRHFTPEEVDVFIHNFRHFDVDNSGSIDSHELFKACKACGETVTFDQVTKQLRSLDTDKSGQIEFAEFLTFIANNRDVESNPVGKVLGRTGKIISVGGATDATQHSINEDEQEQFTDHINDAFKNDPHLKARLPIDGKSMELYRECQDGILLSKLINEAVRDTIDERALNLDAKHTFHKTENNNVVINSAKAIGCNVVNIGAQDLIEGRPHLVLGLIWQIIKIGLLAKISLRDHPELYRLLDKDEELEEFVKLPADVILLRWVNFHLRAAGHPKRINNFSGDIKDGVIYTVLLHQLSPEFCPLDPLDETDLLKRAEMVLNNADALDCRRYINAKSLVAGNPKLNLAFVANLFNHHPGLDPLTKEEMAALDESLFTSEGDREARAFSLWMNSLGVDPFVYNLFDDLRDGLVLLQAFDKVHPGIVEWKKVNTKRPVKSRFKMVENTNYAVLLGKSLKFSLVGIQGADITDGNKKLTLALVWQLMREHVIQILKTLAKDGKNVTDADMVKWANGMTKRAGKKTTMSSFRDPSLSTGLFFLDVMGGMKKRIVNYELVTPGQTEDDAKMNAKYAISIARKLGATLFVLPEDIVEVKPKMILTFIGSLMAIERSGVLDHVTTSEMALNQ